MTSPEGPLLVLLLWVNVSSEFNSLKSKINILCDDIQSDWPSFECNGKCALDSPDRPDESLYRGNNLLHGYITIGFVLHAVLPYTLHWGDKRTKCYTEMIPACHTSLINTISRRTRLQPKGRSEACAVVKAPALLDLPRARAVGHVLLVRGVPHIGAWRQRRSLAPDGLRWPGIVHPDPIPEANFTADSEEKNVETSGGTVSDQIHGCSEWSETSVGGVLLQ